MTIKRMILGLLTLVVIILVSTALVSSWTKPQIQSQLQLYQTNILLQAAEWQVPEGEKLGSTRNALIGEQPVKTALTQYQEVRQSAQKNLERLSAPLTPLSPESELDPKLGSAPVRRSPQQQLQSLINQLDLRLGILHASSGQAAVALQTWQGLIAQPESSELTQTAAVLSGLWSDPPRLLPDAEQQLSSSLKGWFRYQALTQLYQLQQRQDALVQLQAAEQEMARSALSRLVIVGGMPVLGSLIGIGLLIVWLVRQVTSQKPSPLSPSMVRANWPVPWERETIWQVVVLWFIAFFGISLLVVPLAVQLLGLNPATFSPRAQTLVALFSYVGLVVAGLSILYFCLRPFLPQPLSWLRINWKGNWFWWGLAGYLAALPLVIVVSLVNQRLLEEQGGANPLLEVILQSRDGITIAVLFGMVAVLAPFFEETLFRGFLLPSLTRYLPPWGAIATSGLLFAIAHLNLSDVLPLTVLGMILGFVYLRSRNLLASMLLHSLWNSGSFLGLLILGGGLN